MKRAKYLKQMANQLTPKQSQFIKGKMKGMNNTDAAIYGGYSPTTASTQATRLLKKDKITRALDSVGLTDKAIANGIKTNVEAGMGIKATASDSLKGLDLASKLKGHQQTQQVPTNQTQTNIYINELKNMTDTQLAEKLEVLTTQVSKLKPLEANTEPQKKG